MKSGQVLTHYLPACGLSQFLLHSRYGYASGAKDLISGAEYLLCTLLWDDVAF